MTSMRGIMTHFALAYTHRWSIGVITYMLLSGNQPFWGPPQEMSWEKRRKIMIDRIMRCEYMKMKGPSWAKISPEAKRFVERMLQMNPSRRPTAEKALSDPWIVKYETYKPQNGMPPQDKQYAIKLQIKRKLRLLVAEELAEDEIVRLKTALERHDPNLEDRITFENLRDSLLQANISPGKVQSLFSDQDLDLKDHVAYIGILNDALDKKERLQEELIQDVFNQCGAESCCNITKEKLRDVLENRSVDKATIDTILGAVDATGNSQAVSCEKVIASLKEQEMQRVDIICRCRAEGKAEDSDDEGLVDETNAVIPGGQRKSTERPRFIYDDASNSVREYRAGDEAKKSNVSV